MGKGLANSEGHILRRERIRLQLGLLGKADIRGRQVISPPAKESPQNTQASLKFREGTRSSETCFLESSQKKVNRA